MVFSGVYLFFHIHGWEITSYWFMWICLSINALISIYMIFFSNSCFWISPTRKTKDILYYAVSIIPDDDLRPLLLSSYYTGQPTIDPRNKLQWNLNRHWCICIKNAFENVVWKITAVLSRPQSVYIVFSNGLNVSSLYVNQWCIVTNKTPWNLFQWNHM